MQLKKNKLVEGTVWITGVTASGKTTLGQLLYDKLMQEGYHNAEFLDGEVLRKKLDRIYGSSVEERFAVLENVIRIANDWNQRGNVAIVSTISHKRLMREIARKALSPFIEVYLKCSIEVCKKRDFKGLYAKAFAGELNTFVGVTEPYELSDKPELILDTETLSISECCNVLFKHTVGFLKNDFLHIKKNVPL